MLGKGRQYLIQRGENIGVVLSYLALGGVVPHGGKTLKMNDRGNLYYQCYDGNGNEVDSPMYADILRYIEFVDIVNALSDDVITKYKLSLATNEALKSNRG